MKIKYVSLALLNIMCFSAIAADSNSINSENGFLNNAFFKDTKFEFSTRNHWKYLKENASQPKEVHSAWGQAFTLNYKSGYLFDTLVTYSITQAKNQTNTMRMVLTNLLNVMPKSNSVIKISTLMVKSDGIA